MDTELQTLFNFLNNAKNPEDIFGNLGIGSNDDRLSNCLKVFRHLVQKAHPDHYMVLEDKKRAEEAFKLLNIMKQKAESKILNNTYGDITKAAPSNEIIKIVANKFTYSLGKILSSGSVSDVFSGTRTDVKYPEVLVKISRNASNNSFISNEAAMLKAIHKDADEKGLIKLFPNYLDSFGVSDPSKTIRFANVFSKETDVYGLDEVIKQYPKGINERDMAWMFKRILSALWYAHQRNIIHGAVLPPNVLINIKTHGIILIDWCFSQTFSDEDKKAKVKAIDTEYEEYYPKLSVVENTITPSTDIYMAAMTMIKILGGDVRKKEIKNVSKEISRIFRACIMEPPAFNDALFVHDEFKKTIDTIFGPPKFRDFVMIKK